MQTVWNRVAQTRTACRCASCVVKSSLSRSTTTATGRRQSKYFTTSTLLYSGAFAVAATTDASVKKKRRAQWDKAFADVREDLDSIGEKTRAHDLEKETRHVLSVIDESPDSSGREFTQAGSCSDDGGSEHWRIKEQSREGREGTQWDAALEDPRQALRHTGREAEDRMLPFDNQRSDVDSRNQHVTSSSSGDDVDNTLRNSSGSGSGNRGSNDLLDSRLIDLADLSLMDPLEIWPPNTGRPFGPYNWPPQSIYAPGSLKDKWAQRLWTEKKLRLLSLYTDLWAIRAISRLGKNNRLADIMDDDYSPDFRRLLRLPTNQLFDLHRHCEDSITMAKKIDPEADRETFMGCPGILTDYMHDEGRRHIPAAATVHNSISKIFDRHQSQNMDQTLTDVLHELTQSRAPPSLRTVNKILWEMKDNDFDYRFIIDFIRAIQSSKIRMNEVTFVGIIDTCVKYDAYDDFCHFFELFSGQKGGLHLAHNGVNISAVSQGRLIRCVRFGKVKTIQLPVPNPFVFDALFQATAKFDGPYTALQLIKAKAPEGWGLTSKGLTPLLAECAKMRQWDHGLTVWKQIEKLHNRRRSGMRGRRQRIPKPTFSTMLHLCRVCGEDAEFETIMDMALSDGHARSDMLNRIDQVGKDLKRELETAKIGGKAEWKSPSPMIQAKNTWMQSIEDQGDGPGTAESTQSDTHDHDHAARI